MVGWFSSRIGLNIRMGLLKDWIKHKDGAPRDWIKHKNLRGLGSLGDLV
jgi:hypothetical protein